MRGARWLALAAGAGLGAVAGCFSAPDHTGPYQCTEQLTCPDPELTCFFGLCCKTDGGDPVCPPPPPPSDGGQGDAGCTIPSMDPCVVSGKQGPCQLGAWSCDTGALACDQTTFPDTEVCGNNIDEDCDGVQDNCDIPGDLRNPDAGHYALGAERVPGTQVSSTRCLKGIAGWAPELFNGARWSVQGAGSLGGSVTNMMYAEADGGTWDLSGPNASVYLQLNGQVYSPADPQQPFAGYFQPYVYLCSENGGHRRFRPFTNDRLGINPDSGTFSLDVTVPVDGGGGWVIGSQGSFNAGAVKRVEIGLELLRPTAGPNVPGFDAGITSFGFFTP